MRAIGFHSPSPTLSSASFSAFDLDMPSLRPTDLLIQVAATSVNPVDYKQRQSRQPDASQPSILGWDGAGTVIEVGGTTSGFAAGDRVYWSGEFRRPGTNAEYQAVDHRLVAKMPENLDFSQAAALPLTAITAYEALFERLRIPRAGAGKVLIIGGAGGVGSIAIQLLKAVTDAGVYATAGREKSASWVSAMGADHVVDRNDLHTQTAQTLPEFDYIFSTTHSDSYQALFPQLLKAEGSLCLIDDPETFDIVPFKLRSQSVSWELIFTKALFNGQIETQAEILAQVSRLIEDGKVRSTLNEKLTGLTPDNLIEAHRRQESGGTIGKTVIEF